MQDGRGSLPPEDLSAESEWSVLVLAACCQATGGVTTDYMLLE